MRLDLLLLLHFRLSQFLSRCFFHDAFFSDHRDAKQDKGTDDDTNKGFGRKSLDDGHEVFLCKICYLNDKGIARAHARSPGAEQDSAGCHGRFDAKLDERRDEDGTDCRRQARSTEQRDKENTPAADQNLLDKLSAEYQEELKNLGVRIGNLERNADTTRFSGYLYLREQNQLVKNKHTGKSTRSKVNRAWFDLISQSQVNKNWKVVTETNTIVDLNKDKTDDTYDLYFASMFADGTYGKFHTQLGRIDNFSQDGGIVMHNPISGGKFTFGNKLRTTLTAARLSSSNLPSLNSGESFDFGAAELAYPASKATKLYGAFYQIHDDKFKVTRGSENPNIYTLGFRSTIAKNLVLTGYYLKASDTTNKYTKDTGWFGSLEYRRIKLDQPGTWSIYTKYANIPELTQLNLDTGHFRDYKGVELGGFYVPAQNIRAHLRYYYGKNVEDTALTKSLVRGEVRIFF